MSDDPVPDVPKPDVPMSDEPMSDDPRRDDRCTLRRIYLDDHWAAAGAGVRLARRLASANVDTPWHPTLNRIVAEIEQDERVLRAMREAQAGGGFSIKRVLATTAERVGRLKLNGRLVGYSPLSRVFELEGLMSGVQAKQCLWRAIRESDGWATDRVDLVELERRAVAQLRDLSRIHDEAAAIAFGSAGEPTV
jgi:hypothetical protein